LDKKFHDGEAIMGKNMFWEWATTSEAKDMLEQGLQAKSLCLRNVLSLKKLSFYVMAIKKQWHFSNEFLRPNSRLL
jgi:hypothetical protein